MGPITLGGRFGQLSIGHIEDASLGDTAYGTLVQRLLLDAKQPLAAEDLRSSLASTFGLQNVPDASVAKALLALTQSGTIKKIDNRFQLSASARADLETAMAQAKADVELVQQALSRNLREVQKISLDRYEAHTVDYAFLGGLETILTYLTESSVDFLQMKSVETEVPALIEAISKSLREADNHVFENRQKLASIQAALPAALDEIFRQPTEAFGRGLWHAACTRVLMDSISAHPELGELRRDYFRGTTVFLDTNVLIAELCESSRRHEATRWLFDACKNIGIQILVTDFTLRELENALRNADRLFMETKGTFPKIEAIDNEIVRSYYEHHFNDITWQEYLTNLDEMRDGLFASFGVQVVSPEDLGIVLAPENVATAAALMGFGDAKVGYSSPVLAQHDARAILMVQAMRKAAEGRLNSPWFITYHRRLRDDDRRIKEAFQFPSTASIFADEFYDALSPFLWATRTEENTGQAFSRMIANTVLPHPPTSARTYARFVLSELEAPVDDLDMIFNAIDRSHRKAFLDDAIRKGENEKALREIRTIVSEGLASSEAERRRQKNTIRRLSLARDATAQEGRGFSLVGNIPKLHSMALEARKAATNDEKKKTLENFAHTFFSMFVGFEIVETNFRSSMEEIDLLIANLAGPAPWGDPILVECKNHSNKIGKPSVTDFKDKMDQQNALTGFLISKSEVTQDAARKLETFTREGRKVVVIYLSEIEAVDTLEGLRGIVLKRFYTGCR